MNACLFVPNMYVLYVSAYVWVNDWLIRYSRFVRVLGTFVTEQIVFLQLVFLSSRAEQNFFFPAAEPNGAYGHFLTSLGGSLAVRRSAVAEESEPSCRRWWCRRSQGREFTHGAASVRIKVGTHADFPSTQPRLQSRVTREHVGRRVRAVDAPRRMVAPQPAVDPSAGLEQIGFLKFVSSLDFRRH